jgi:hypothetical protein
LFGGVSRISLSLVGLNSMRPTPIIPDHELLRQIGAGSFGEVWLARTVCGSYRAVKLVYRAAFDEPGPFEREFEGIQLFEPVSRTHDNLVAVLHVGRSEVGGYFYYVMEVADDRVTGEQIDPERYEPRTLGGELRERGRMGLIECCELGLKLTAGLGHLHSRGLLHRDVKPSNVIFVNRSPKFADIGLVTRMTDTATPMGTLGYMPERGYGTPGADLYALGKVLYEALTGLDRGVFPELPTDWGAEGEVDSLVRFNEIVLKACQEDPGRRYASARQMFEELNRVFPRIQTDEGTIRKWFHLLWTKNGPPPPMEQRRLETSGGAVPLDSAFYVERPADDELGVAIARGDGIILVKGARQMGKTSLLARGLQQARRRQARVVLTDLQDFTDSDLESLESFYRAVCDSVLEQVEEGAAEPLTWERGRSPNLNFERFVRRVMGNEEGRCLFWGWDEVDRLFGTPYGERVFAIFRSWHNRRALDPDGPWGRLMLALVCATEAHLFITDLNQSPFNVGTQVRLDDFSLEQVSELNRRYGGPLQGRGEIARFHQYFEGQPYLTRRGLHEMVMRACPLDRFEVEASREGGVFGDHLRRLLASVRRDEGLWDALRGWLKGEKPLDAESFYRLRSAGVVKGESGSDARPRCELYGQYLRRQLSAGGV